MRILITLLTCLLISPLVQANDAANNDALTLELRAMAQDFAKIVEKKGGGAVAIGEFSASSDVRASVSPQIQLVLAAEMKAAKISVDQEKFRFEIKGDYQPVIDKETNLLGVKVIGRLIERDTGEPLAEKPTGRFVFGAETVPTMLGLTVPGKPTADPEEISDRLKKAKDRPTAHRDGTQVKSVAESPFALEILVKAGGSYQPRKVEVDDKGRLLVPIHKLELYGVRLINNSAHEVAVDLRIDGVNCFAFSETNSKYWILDPKSKMDVIGWHKSNTKTIEFKAVEDFADTAAAKLNLKPSPSIGLITVSFSASWENDAKRPADEMFLASRGTGFGSEIKVLTNQLSRTIGQVRDVIAIRYER